jgi:hypothetical protein
VGHRRKRKREREKEKERKREREKEREKEIAREIEVAKMSEGISRTFFVAFEVPFLCCEFEYLRVSQAKVERGEREREREEREREREREREIQNLGVNWFFHGN